MSRKENLLVGAGVLAVLAGAVLVFVGPSGTGGPLVDVAVVVVGIVGVLVLLWMVGYSTEPTTTESEPIAWADVGPLTRQAPERTPSEYPLASRDLSDWLETACRRAREKRHPRAGLEVMRDPLAEPLVKALVAGGMDRQRAEQSVHEGTWTDDPVAAATLSGEFWPAESLRQRLRNWLFPAREVRRRTRRTVAEIADVTADRVPAVVGQDTPRRIPVRPPTLDEQERGADGEIQPAASSAFGYRWTHDSTSSGDSRRDGT